MQLYIFDRNDNLLDIITDYFNSEYNRAVNGEWGFKFETPFNEYLVKNNKIGIWDRHNKFRLFEIQGVEEDYNYDTCIVETLNDYVSLNHTIIEDKRVVNGNCRSALEKVLEGTNYKIGNIEPTILADINFYFCTRLKGLNDILKTYNCELDTRIEISEDGVIKAKYIDLLYTVGKETNIRCTYDTNLTSFKRIPLEGHCTVIYGRGKSLETEGGGFSRKLTFEDVIWTKPNNPVNKPQGVKYLEDSEAIKKYGRIEGIFEDDKIEDPSILIERSWIALQNAKIPKFSYEGSIKDLEHLEEFKHYKIEIGDTIVINNEDKDLVVQSRLIKENYTLDPDVDIDVKITLGNFTPSLSSDDTDVKAEIDKAIGNIDIDIEIKDESYPDTLPNTPIVTGVGGLNTIGISWTYESKNYYTYEVYASTVKNFNPNFTQLVFKGQASRYLHECNPKETWYFKVRGVNTYGRTTDFSDEVEVSTTAIKDGTTWIENGAIGDALIGTLRLDRGWFGVLKGQYMDLKEVRVSDGNDDTVFHIDSFARLYANFTELNINSLKVATENKVLNDINEAKKELNTTITNVNDSVNNVKDVLLPSLEDNVLTESEKNSIESNLKPLNTSFGEITKEYETLYSNADLEGVYKTNLKNGYDDYKLKYDGLVSTINNLLSLNEITNDNKVALNNAYNAHDRQLELYRQRVNEAMDSIADKKKNDALDGANTYTNTQISIVNNELTLKASKEELDGTNNRLTAAEEKITPDAIVKTVKESQTDGKNTFVQGSELEQTKTEFNYKFENTGAINEVENSDFSDGDRRWALYNSEAACFVERGSGYSGRDIKVTTALYLGDCTGKTAYAYQHITPKNICMKKFTISACYHYDNVNITEGQGYPMAYIYIEIYNKDGTVEYYNQDHVLYKGQNYIGWINHSNTYTRSGKEIDTVKLMAYKRNTNGIFRVTQIDLHEGGLIREWTPCTTEISNNISTIDGEGIKVTHEQGSFTRVNHQEFYQANENGDRTVSMRHGGLRLYQFPYGQDAYRGYLGGLSATKLLSGVSYGESLFGTQHSQYIDLGFNEGWEDGPQSNILPWLRLIHYDSPFGKQGVHMHKTLYTGPRVQVESGLEFIYNDSNLDSEKSFININGGASTGNRELWLSGADVVNLMVQNGGYFTGHKIIEDWTSAKVRHESWGHWDMHGWTINNVNIARNLVDPSRGVGSYRRADREITQVMSTSKLIQDRGEDSTSNGFAMIEIPNDIKYNIGRYDVSIIKYGRGDIWVSERNYDYFVVESENDIKFTWILEGEVLETQARTTRNYDFYAFEKPYEKNMSDIERTILASKFSAMEDVEIYREVLKCKIRNGEINPQNTSEEDLYKITLFIDNQLWQLYTKQSLKDLYNNTFLKNR